jgi:hypothetical protein
VSLAEAFRARLEEALDAAARLATSRPLLGPPAELERLALAKWPGTAPRPPGLPWPLEVGAGVELARGTVAAAAERLAGRLEALAEELLPAGLRAGALARLVSGDGLAERPLLLWPLRGEGREAWATAEEAALEAVLAWFEEGRPRRWPDDAEPAAVRDWLSGRYQTPEAEAVAWFILSRTDLAWLYLAERAERLDTEDRGFAERLARERTERFLGSEEEARACVLAALSELEGVGNAAAGRVLARPERVAALAVELLEAGREIAAPIVRRPAVLAEGELLSWDRALLEALERLGADPAPVRAASERRAAEGWAPRLPGIAPPPAWGAFTLWRIPHRGTPPLWAQELAPALWFARWARGEAEGEERLAERRRRGGLYGGVSVLPLAVAGGLAEGGLDARRYREEEEGDQLRLFVPERQEVARIDLRIYREIAERLAEAPPAVDALLTYAIGAGFERWRGMPEDGLGDGEIIIPGGKARLREALGCSSADVEYALQWGQSLHLPRIDVRGLWLWNGTYQTAAPGREALGLLTIQRALLPRAEHDYTGRGAYFVPWTPTPPLPDLRRGRGALLRLWRFLSVALASASAEGRLREEGAVLPEARLRALAERAGVEWRLAEGALARWVEEGALERRGDTWRLGVLFPKERAVLEGNASIYAAARRGGLARAEAVTAGRAGKGGKSSKGRK